MAKSVAISKDEPDQIVNVTVKKAPESRINQQIDVVNLSSEGERSLLRKNPVWLISPKAQTTIFNTSLNSLDEFIATPLFNVNVIKNACNKDFKFFDAINKSKYAAYIDSSLVTLGLFSVSIGIYIVKYCKLREKERKSNYFYFSRLLKIDDKKDIKNKMGEIEQKNFNLDTLINYEHLLAAAYFYTPDISKIACWRRRFFSYGKKRKQLKDLNFILIKNKKEEILEKLLKEILEKTCQLLNKKSKFKKFELKKSAKNKWIIGLTDKYAEKIFLKFQHLIKINSIINKENNDKMKMNFLSTLLPALGQSSFVYWILMFIFCFIPSAPVITTASISIIPLVAVLLGVFPFLLIFNTYNAYKTFKTKKSMTLENIEEKHKALLEKKVVFLNKEKVFLNYFKMNKINSTVGLKNSLLMTDLKAVLKNRRFSKFHAIFMGFLDGCLFPFFVGWLLLDGVKIILTYMFCPSILALTSFTPIGLLGTAIITGVSLLIGIGYGIYSAYKANQDYELRFNNIQVKVKVLCDEVPNKRVLNKSLRDYDRLLRRFSDKHPFWTKIKKASNRLMVIIKRLGTGSLVFRLVIWGPITATVAASMSATPVFFPIILIIGIAVGAFVFSAWYLYAYNLESKMRQAGRIVEHLVQTEKLNCIDVGLSDILNSENIKDPFNTKNNTSTEAEMENVQNETNMEKANNYSSLNSALFVENKDQSSNVDSEIENGPVVANSNY